MSSADVYTTTKSTCNSKLRYFFQAFCIPFFSIFLALHAPLGFAGDITQVSDEEEVIRLTFLRQWVSNTPTSYTYFICIGDKAPSDRLMQGLSDVKPQLRKCSDSFDSVKRRLEAEDQANKVWIITLGEITWESDTEVKFQFSSYLGSLASSGSTISMRRVNGEWKLIKSTLNYIS